MAVRNHKELLREEGKVEHLTGDGESMMNSFGGTVHDQRGKMEIRHAHEVSARTMLSGSKKECECFHLEAWLGVEEGLAEQSSGA
jgi:hypothetical protein